MAKIEAVDTKTHKDLFINPAKSEAHGSGQHLIPTVIQEFTNIAVQNPIVLTKNGETGEFVFTAMYGFEAGENLFWQQNQWQGHYLPLQLQRQPFFIGQGDLSKEHAGSEHIVCIDVDSPTVSRNNNNEEGTQPLFTENGQYSDYFVHAKQCLAQIFQGEKNNKALSSMLLSLELIQPLSLEVSFANEQSTRLNGLYTINQEKLASLSSENIARLHQQGLLQPIYTMITSLAQIYALIALKNAKLAADK